MNKEEKVIKNLKELYFKNLDAIYKVCKDSAKEFNSKSIPLELLDTCIKEVKKGFNIGIKKGK